MITLTPRERRHQRTRQAILDAARELINAGGADALSMRKIAQRIDYSPAGLYEYFGSKDEIIATLTAEGEQRLIMHMQRVPVELSPAERLVELGLAYVDFALQNSEHFLLGNSLPSKRATLDDPVASGSSYDILLQTVQAGIEAGEFVPWDNYGLEAIAYGCWALIHGMAMLRLTQLRHFQADFDAANRRALEVFVEGLKASL